MASNLPKVLINITLTGSRILGRALKAGFNQAAANVKHRPDEISDQGESSNKASSSTRSITNQLKMTRDEAEMILNVPSNYDRTVMAQRFELLFKANSPPVVEANPVPGVKKDIIYHSHYLQSKVFRAKERLEAELPEEIAEVESKTNQTESSEKTDSESGSASKKE